MTDRGPTPPRDPTADPLAHPDDAGAYVGREKERQAETIPGGVRPGDERIAAHSTQSQEPVEGAPPSGHRQESRADENEARDAGSNR
jgi:hypothetical protein